MNQAAFDPEEHIPTKDVARRTGTSPRLWDSYRANGEGPTFVKLSSRCIRYRWGDVLAWLDSRKLKSSNLVTGVK